MDTFRPRLETFYHTHQNFILLLLLFVSFRAFALLAYRPGGLILDFSDFYWYREFAQLDRQGYVPYHNLWTTYPPLFPVLMINIWKTSALLPPWEFNNLWFTLLLGSIFLLFEVGNFILLYLMALKIYSPQDAFKPAWVYAGFFVPVYTVTGWFESYPLFFFLLSLYLLLIGRPYLSALAAGVGFMIKLIPLILLPIGAKLAPQTGKWGRLQIRPLNIDFDILGVIVYSVTFAVTVIAIAAPFYLQNPDLILAPLQITSARLPWETIWALFEGNYDYGVIPLDMRDMAWTPAGSPQSTLPWLWITAIFGLVYLFLYTRRIDWGASKSVMAFTGLSICLFFLYSKGYSPQWLGWLLIFIALLLPNLRGVLYAIVLSLANLLEANLFFIMFPQEHWLLATTVLVRTGLIIVLAVEFGFIIWPRLETPSVIAIRRYALLIGCGVLLLASPLMASRLLTTYTEQRLESGPYSRVISWLREQPVKEAIVMNNHQAYDWFYPYLGQSHAFFMLDDYAGSATSVETKTTRLYQTIKGQYPALWVFDSDPAETTPAERTMFQHLTQAQLAHQADIDGGRLYLFILNESQ